MSPHVSPQGPVLGLTGAVGAGKSTVARLLAGFGCVVLDADRMGHEALDDPSVRDAVVREFGGAAASRDGSIDRRALAARVFGDAAALRRLEALVHPVVAARLAGELAASRARAPRAVVIDCALLFESGTDAVCDATIAVEAPDGVRRRRVQESRGWTAEETQRREAAQFSAAEKRARADRVLANDGDEDELGRRVRAVLDELAPVKERGRTDAAAGRSER